MRFEIDQLSVCFSQCSTILYHVSRAASVNSEKQSVALTTQLCHQSICWHSRHGSGSTSLWKKWVLTEAAGSKQTLYVPTVKWRALPLVLCTLSIEKHWNRLFHGSLYVTERLSEWDCKKIFQKLQKKCGGGSLGVLDNTTLDTDFVLYVKVRMSTHFFNLNDWSTSLKNRL